MQAMDEECGLRTYYANCANPGPEGPGAESNRRGDSRRDWAADCGRVNLRQRRPPRAAARGMDVGRGDVAIGCVGRTGGGLAIGCSGVGLGGPISPGGGSMQSKILAGGYWTTSMSI